MLLLCAYAVTNISGMEIGALVHAIKDRKFDEARSLLKDPKIRAMINAHGQNGDTPLINALALYTDEKDAFVVDLINAGADPRISNAGFAPLMMAASQASLETIKLLCAHGALETITQVHEGETALNWACKSVTWNPYRRVVYFVSQCPQLSFLTEVDFVHLVLHKDFATLEYLLGVRKNWAQEKIREGIACAKERGETGVQKQLENYLAQR